MSLLKFSNHSILATGGVGGFIGSNLMEALFSPGEEVVVLDGMHTGSPKAGLQGRLNLIPPS